MPITPASNYNSDLLSDELVQTLLTGKDFSLPALDIADASFNVPGETGNPLYAAISPISIDTLTDGTVDGTGVFDKLMTSLSAHLKGEFDKGRITGEQYSKAYISLTTAALGTASQFALTQQASLWQAHLAQMQARAAEVDVIDRRLAMERTRSDLFASRVNAEVQIINFATGKIRLSLEDENYGIAQATRAKIIAENTNVVAQTARVDYERTNILPKEVDRIQNQIDVGSGQISQMTAQTNQVLYETASLLPARLLDVQAETAIRNYQLNSLLPAQLGNVTEDTTGKNYTNQNILPEQLKSLKEQTEAHRAKTLDTRTDGITAISGAIGKTKELQQQQIDSYQRDAEAKVAKMFLDTWITQKSLDEGLVAPSGLSDSNINTVLTKVRTELAMT